MLKFIKKIIKRFKNYFFGTISIDKVTDIEINGIDTKDYPDFVDAYICSAKYKKSGKEVSDEHLDYLNEHYSDIIHELAFEQIF